MKAEFPFNEYLIHKFFDRTKKRWWVKLSLISDKSQRISMYYSRYLMCVKEKRILRKDEEVDHIDNNQLNDRIENLQILTKSQHSIKTGKEREIKIVEHGTLIKYIRDKCRCILCVLNKRRYDRNYERLNPRRK